MRRVITYFNALLLGVILGMIFVAIVDAIRPHGQPEVCASEAAVGYKAFTISVSLARPAHEHTCQLRK